MGWRAPGTAALSLAFAATIVGLLPADAAFARTETIRWTHPDAARVTAFQIRIGSASGNYTSTVNAGKPTPSGGVYSTTVTVADGATAYAVIQATNATQQSVNSNERVLRPPTTPPPPPPPPPPGEGALIGAGVGVNGEPAGWVDTRPRSQLTTDANLFKVMSLSGNLVYGTTSTSADIHSHFATDVSEDWTAYELRGRMRISHADGGIGVTVMSQYPDEDAYYRLRRSQGASTAAFHMSPHPQGRMIACTSGKTSVVPLPNLWYRFRMQAIAESGRTVVRSKAWADGAPEPAAWQIDCADTNGDRLRAGVPGVWSMGPGAKYWDDLEIVDVDGSAPPPPPLGAPDAPILLGP
jgi:hypothetical protein